MEIYSAEAVQNRRSSCQCPWKLSDRGVEWLQGQIRTAEDLEKKAAPLVSSLSRECQELQDSVKRLDARISAAIEQGKSHLGRMSDVVQKGLEARIINSMSRNRQQRHNLPLDELPQLAKEVAIVDRIRVYAETALQLEALVGDLEDAVAAAVVRHSRKGSSSSDSECSMESQEKLMVAINTLREIEDVISGVVKTNSQWGRLVMAVDLRVDRAIATVRPLAITHYRTLLNSLGWPPSLVTMDHSTEDITERTKPSKHLFGHHSRSTEKFSSSFLVLCILQSVHLHRKARQFGELKSSKDYLTSKIRVNKYKLGVREMLWSIEELVSQIESRAKYHFSRWTKKPEFIFALAYKVIQEYVDVIDDVCQPLVDKSRLLGYSAREEWVSAMVSMTSKYLSESVFPNLVAFLAEETSVQAQRSWLNVIDLIIEFDKKMHVLAVRSGVASSASEDTDTLNLSVNMWEPRVYCMSVFCDQPSWVKLWARTELKTALAKLKSEFEISNFWRIDVEKDMFSSLSRKANYNDDHKKFLFSTREDYKSPKVAEIVVMATWTVINRCRTLPDALLRYEFVRSAAAPILVEYLGVLLQRCQEAEAMTALADDEAMMKVASSINASRFCYSTVKEWCEDIFFLDLQLAHELSDQEATKLDTATDAIVEDNSVNVSAIHDSVFDPEIANFIKFQSEWLDKLIAVILRSFDANCQEYVRNKKQWQEINIDKVSQGDKRAEDTGVLTTGSIGTESEISISPLLVDALDTLQGQLKTLKGALNAMDFTSLWRRTAADLDQFLFNKIFLSKAKFSDHGVQQLKVDIHGLLQIFKLFCVRPAAFFPYLTDSLRLLALPSPNLTIVRRILASPSLAMDENKDDIKLKNLKQHGIKQILPSDAQKILKQRIMVDME